MGVLPPLHPAFVHFPIALVVFAVIAECVAHFRKSEALRATAWWALCGAAAGALAAIGTGEIDIDRSHLQTITRKYAEFHSTVGYTALVAILILAAWRGFLFFRKKTPHWSFLGAGALVLLLLLFQGWLGGELVESYGAGVAPTGQSPLTAAAAQAHLEALEKVFGPFSVEDEGRKPDSKP